MTRMLEYNEQTGEVTFSGPVQDFLEAARIVEAALSKVINKAPLKKYKAPALKVKKAPAAKKAAAKAPKAAPRAKAAPAKKAVKKAAKPASKIASKKPAGASGKRLRRSFSDAEKKALIADYKAAPNKGEWLEAQGLYHSQIYGWQGQLKGKK